MLEIILYFGKITDLTQIMNEHIWFQSCLTEKLFNFDVFYIIVFRRWIWIMNLQTLSSLDLLHHPFGFPNGRIVLMFYSITDWSHASNNTLSLFICCSLVFPNSSLLHPLTRHVLNSIPTNTHTHTWHRPPRWKSMWTSGFVLFIISDYLMVGLASSDSDKSAAGF